MFRSHLASASIVAGLLLGGFATMDAKAQEPRDVTPHETIGDVERLDPALDTLIDPTAKIEVLAEGFDWSEGPLWIAEGNFLIFSDVPQNVIYKWKEDEGLSEYLRPSGYTSGPERGGEMGSNGLTLDQNGNLLLCQHGDLRVARMLAPVTKPEPRYETVAKGYQGKNFNSPNDLVCHSSGAVYFTDPPYGREHGQFNDPSRELDFQGVFRADPDGTVTLLTKELRAPNGIAFSPDEKILYVAQSWGEKMIWMAYPVKEDGGIEEGKILHDATERAKQHEGSADGMKVDAKGNLFASGPGGIMIITPEGKHLGTIRTGTRISNCAFGDDGRTLYMTCDGKICRVRLKTIGATFIE
jgi:gluconolactonase